MRQISKKTGIPCVASVNSRYASPEDFDDQRLLVCSKMSTTFNNVDYKFAQDNNAWLKQFFQSGNYYIPSTQQIELLHSDNLSEVSNSLAIADMCEEYNILSKPIIPKFDCPDGKTADAYLKELCVAGWNKKIKGKVPAEKLDEYKAQIREELSVIQGAGLSSYFLIVEDYCRYATEVQGQLLGDARGSCGGSLIAYLTNITKIDPVHYGLMFERFYNAGRNTADRVSLPDIDTDFEDRDKIIPYIVQKYGRDKVGQMITFNRIQGKGSIKEVFRVKYPDISMDEVGKITENLPADAEISDKLQEMKENGEEASIIMWALETNAKKLKPYCYIDEHGKFQGEYAKAFEQAVRLEGTKKSQSKHPSGLVITNTPLADLVPMVYDKTSKESICGLEMASLEALGCTKFDILGISALKKLHNVSRLLATGNFDD
jgi:DNA polymerase-3 subunit alpha